MPCANLRVAKIELSHPVDMYFGGKFFSFNLLLRVLPCLSVRSNIIVAATVSKDAAENWIPSDEFSNTSSINWFARKRDEDLKTTKTSFARNFQDDDATTIDRAFNDYVNYNNEFNDRDDYKAIPFQIPAELISASGGGGGGSTGNNNAAAHFHSTIFQQQQQQPQSNLAKPFYPAAAQTSPPLSYSPNAAAAVAISSLIPHAQSSPSAPFASNIYQPYQAPSQNLENFDYLPPAPYPPSRFVDNATNIELNTRHLLYLQPGKCSNSIEVGRLRDLEIKSTVKSGTPDNQKAVCVLMLYSANENNKLAISMQSTVETASAELATENWLERNIKVYSLQGGTIARTPTELVDHTFPLLPT